ncbi:hypothetical protein Pla22_47090 [Rubripirellula amarantea]|uniref:Uncharacterized protein n=2 Tax=Rubripirellula amarantea TaxID=2527999 RepID=A0A5C5WI83_9BACT|nr:hypothetical protein Pla22_47090 [Rubripirellula amarantea]
MIGVMIAATIVSLTAVAYCVGQRNAMAAQINAATVDSTIPLPLLEASASVTSEKYSMATGNISEDADGVFVLDHNSGLLQCSVIYPRVGRFMSAFTINVADALGTSGKGGSYIMVTGRADFPRASNRPAASTVIYVMDTATGNYACFGVPFDRVAMNANRQQQGSLVLITTGTANPVIDRDDLR